MSPTLARARRRYVGILLALIGIGVCVTAVLGFVTMLRTNNLPGGDDGTFSTREYYLVVGRSYSQGFTVGFFFCLFLALVAVTVRDHVIQGRRRRRAEALARVSSSGSSR